MGIEVNNHQQAMLEAARSIINGGASLLPIETIVQLLTILEIEHVNRMAQNAGHMEEPSY